MIIIIPPARRLVVHDALVTCKRCGRQFGLSLKRMFPYLTEADVFTRVMRQHAEGYYGYELKCPHCHEVQLFLANHEPPLIESICPDYAVSGIFWFARPWNRQPKRR